MRKFPEHYEEEYVYLADLTDTAALVSWGKFFFARRKKSTGPEDLTARLVPDRKIRKYEDGRRASIGENCRSYGPVVVEVRDSTDAVVNTTRVEKGTFTWIKGLKPDTDYTYRVVVASDGGSRNWADEPLYDYDPKNKKMVPTSRTYNCGFRTFPSLDVSADLTFAVIGDTGTGKPDQRTLADALKAVIDERKVRLVLVTGDMVYKSSGGSGDDDDDWLMTYFQPYRTIIDHIPFYPCVGNHDNEETPFEGSGDTLTLYDNLLVNSRFRSALPGRDACVENGLFYRFRFGRDIEFVCLDTSKDSLVFGDRLFEEEPGKTWMEKALASPLNPPTWRIPFSHHPPYCAGPSHGDTDDLYKKVIPLCVTRGVRAFISGHEHNFQWIDNEKDIDRPVCCIVTGGAAKWSDGKPDKRTKGCLRAWGGHEGTHFLIVEIKGSSMTIEPLTIDEHGTHKALKLLDPQGKKLVDPLGNEVRKIVVRL